MNKARSRFISIGGAIAVGGFCACFGKDIPFAEQWPLYDALRNTSSIIFAVIGAWLTILYPDAIKQVFSRHANFNKTGVADIELMVSNIRYSTAILAIILAVGITGQILKHTDWALVLKDFMRAGSFGLLGALTFLQFWSLAMTLAQAEKAREKLSGEAQRKDRIGNYNSNAQFLDKSESGKE